MIDIIDDFDNAVKIFDWNKKLLSLVGLWPLKQNIILYIIVFIYWSILMILEYIDFYLFINNLEHVIENLSESISFIQAFFHLIMLKKYNKKLKSLPYRFHIFYEINNTKIYAIIYAAFLPVMFVCGVGQVAADCILVTMTFNVCGNLAVLALRITSIDTNSIDAKKIFKQVVIEHSRLLKLGKNVSDVFSEICLMHLASATTLICIILYQILLTFEKGNKEELAPMIVYIMLILVILYAHCIVGEALLNESERVCEAYYNCEWYNMPTDAIKGFILTIAQSQRPISLTCASFPVIIIGGLAPAATDFLLITIVYYCYSYGQKTEIVSYISYILVIFMALYIHCVVGESLVTESKTICEAYYCCDWYNMTNGIQKDCTLGILRSQKVLSCSPVMIVAGLYPVATDVLLITIVYYISSKLSVLSLKIANINSNSINLHDNIKEITIEHKKLIQMGKKTRKVFSEILLFHFIGSTTLICLVGYEIITSYASGQKTGIATYIFYILFVFLALYVHCVVGESLVTESNKICEAYYNCNWYNMPNNIQKYCILGILRSQKMLCLTFGKFGIFNLRTMTKVVKTSMGYLSVLRSFINIE
ncbi:uncharacterized protein LOC122847624 [Aphidius gifuensis]|uniref:uncharacterized protein LOC122847624 n=1 Tax=Aphidius gifuensis TaxID=684658 RepID=UPI001CDC1F62|nr:uncharacterized protein LOC122847624 [Aphidius gifuensis]